MTTESDLEYLRNINTRPGPGAGRSIDPSKPGPDADRIAWRELVRDLRGSSSWLSAKILCPLAADEIERLHAALARAADRSGS